MPSVKSGEKQGHYMQRCVPMLIKEGKKQDQAVAQCLNMFREKWHAKGNTAPDYSEEFFAALADYDWNDCPECLEREKKLISI